MAQVTIELRNLLKTNFELFDFDYNFDDKKFAKELEQAVIDHYWNYEIGQETPDDFKRVFKRRWLQAMSYYNDLHNTTLLEYNPLINHKMSEALNQLRQSTTNQDSQNTSSSEGSTDSTSNLEENSENTRTDNLTTTATTNERFSDYPQEDIGQGDFLSGERLTDQETTNTGTVKNISNNGATTTDQTTVEDSTTSTGTVTTEGTDNTNYEKTIEGLTGRTYQELIKLERENLLRITGMVIEEMKPCFILVY